jgi:hypothetical protein
MLEEVLESINGGGEQSGNKAGDRTKCGIVAAMNFLWAT